MAEHKYMRSPPNLTGMPPGVPYIIGNEAAERFSYYGMKSVLTVFMAHFILNQSGLLAPMQENEAYMYTHYFVFGVYFLPILGAILADGWLGKYWTILSLSIVYCLGNLTLAFMATSWGIAIGQRTMLAIGLYLICLGAGGIKPCVSANVGDQFGESNRHLLSKMFGWFYFSINAGSFISSILCPWLLANPKWGPGWAFGIPWDSDGYRDLVLLGRSQENGARAAGRPQLFERNIQQGRSYHPCSYRNGLRFYFGLLGALGNEQRR